MWVFLLNILKCTFVLSAGQTVAHSSPMNPTSINEITGKFDF